MDNALAEESTPSEQQLSCSSGKYRIARRMICRAGPRRFEAIKHCLSRYVTRQLVERALADSVARFELSTETLTNDDIERVLDDAMFSLRWLVDEAKMADLMRDIGKVLAD